MNYNFKNDKELIEYFQSLTNKEKIDFYNEIDQFIHFIKLRDAVYKGKIANILLNEFENEKDGILNIKDISSQALDLSEYKSLNLVNDIQEVESKHMCELFDTYLKVIYKYNSYYNKVNSVANMFASNLFGCGDYPDVPGILTGAYNGRGNGYNQNEAKSKFIETIMTINNIFEEALLDSYEFSGPGLVNYISKDLIYDIAKYCIENNKVSINMIQNQFNLGFNKVNNIINELIEMGAIKQSGNTKEIVWTIDDLNKLLIN